MYLILIKFRNSDSYNQNFLVHGSFIHFLLDIFFNVFNGYLIRFGDTNVRYKCRSIFITHWNVKKDRMMFVSLNGKRSILIYDKVDLKIGELLRQELLKQVLLLFVHIKNNILNDSYEIFDEHMKT